MTRLLLGADVGGTSTRVAVADLTGAVRGVAVEPAGNPNAVGVEVSADRIRTAAERLLTSSDEVVAVVLGMAGFNTARAAGPGFLRRALPDRVAVVPHIVSDLGVAYASGTPLPHGYVVIAGTGSGAAEIDGGEIVVRRGAWGWLLGDEGGGFWLGREAVRHALGELQRGTVRSDLTRLVLDHFGIDTEPAIDHLLRIPYEQPPTRLADLAPVLTGLLDSDPAAAAIAARASGLLAELVLDLQPKPGRPIVTAGSVLQSTAIGGAFTERIASLAGCPVYAATTGLVGALWLAYSTVSPAPDPGVHAQLQRSLPTAQEC